MASSKQHRKKICVYCRDRESTTADHVFPRAIFQRDQRNDLPKVPSCEECNNEKSRLEHYLLSVLPFGATHPHAHQALSADVPRRLGRNQKLYRELNSGFGYSYIPGESNSLERRLHVKVDADVLHEFIGFVGRGLMWHHWRRYLPQECAFRAFTPSPTGIQFLTDLFNLNTPHRVQASLGGETVRYKGVMSEADERVSAWAIQLLGGITLSTANHSHVFKNSFVAMISGPPNIISNLAFENAI